MSACDPPVATHLEPPAARGRLTAVFAALLVAAAIAANQSAIHWRENLVDSDLFAYYGWCVADGARPYLDVWDNKPPGIWWVNALAIRLCGPTPAADVLLGAAALGGAALGFLAAARALFAGVLRWPAALAAVVFLTHVEFECGANRTETWVLAAECLAAGAYLAWRRRPRTTLLWLAGLAAGAAPLFKQSGLAVTLAAALDLAGTQLRARRFAPRPWLLAASGWVIVPGLAALALAAQGGLGAALYAVGGFNALYFRIGDATWTGAPHALLNYPALAPLWPAFALALIGGAAGVAPRTAAALERAPDGSRSYPGLGFVWAWLALALYLAAVGPGRQGHHVMPSLAPLGLLTLAPLAALARGDLARRLTTRPTAVIALVLWAGLLVRVGAGSVAGAQRAWSAKTSWCATAWRTPPPGLRQGRAIAALTRPTDRIYVHGWDPAAYRYAVRRAASRYATLEKVGQLQPLANFLADAAWADVQRAPPTVLVIAVSDWAHLQHAADPRLADWIARCYAPGEAIVGMQLFMRRPAAPPPRP